MPDLPADVLLRLRRAADEARRLNYSPYSGFVALAAAETTSGACAGGSNVENVNFSLTKHAEEIAIVRAFDLARVAPAPGGLRYVYVAGGAPCGGCRQFAHEFRAPGALWIVEPVEQSVLAGGMLADLPADGERLVLTFEEMLPVAFGAGVMTPAPR